MEQQRVHDRDRIWAGWMRAANAGDEIAYRRLLGALARSCGHWCANATIRDASTARAALS